MLNLTKFTLLAAFAILGLMIVRSYGNEGYHANGKLEFKIVLEDGSISQTTRSQFDIVVQDCTWRIRVNRDGDTNFDYVESAYDGTNIYELIDFETFAARDTQSSAIQKAGATIQSSSVPHLADAHEIPIIWFAYASRCSFAIAENKKTFEPVSRFGIQLKAFDFLATGHYRQRFQISTNESGFPDHATWFDDGFLYNAHGQKTPRLAPFDTEFTNSDFISLSSRHVSGLTLPDHFKLTTFRPKRNAKSIDDIIGSYQYECWMTNADTIPSTRQNFIPKLPGPTHVLDRRFRDKLAMNVDYDIDERWLTAAQVEQLPQFRKMLNSPQHDYRGPASSRVFVLVAMTAITIGFLALALIRNRAMKVQTTTTSNEQ